MAETATAQDGLFDQLTSWANLIAAARKTRLGKRRQADCARFELERERELLCLQDELRTRTYRPGLYRTFYVREPKRRMISAASYRDRVVHHALANVIGPLFDRNFITDSYANRIGKGTHRAVDRYQRLARRFRYVLPCDIVKFFASVDHEILKGLLRSRIRDEGVLWLCDLIIDASNAQEPVNQYFPGDDLFSPHHRRRGLPIGNMTSQFWANVYLHGLDNFVKRGLGCRGYVRYVDDFLVLGNDKRWLAEIKERIVEHLERLRLCLHEERAQVRPTSRPVRFLGYRCWPTHRYLTKESIRRFRRRARGIQARYADGRLDWADVKRRLAAWNAHAATADGRRLRWRTLAALKFMRGTRLKQACPSRRQLEQQSEQLPVREAQQQHARQPQQQHRFSLCVGESLFDLDQNAAHHGGRQGIQRVRTGFLFSRVEDAGDECSACLDRPMQPLPRSRPDDQTRLRPSRRAIAVARVGPCCA